MNPSLNEDILTLIYSHVFDFDILRTTATAFASDHHPLRTVVLRRLLQLPLHLSCENLGDSTALIDHFVCNVARAGLVRDLSIILGPCRKAIAEYERYGQTDIPEYLEHADKADALVKLLPELLKHTGHLRRLDWSRYPPPSKETLEVLSGHSSVHLSLDCSEDSEVVSMLFSEESEISDTTTNMKLLFSTVGSKATSLDLRKVDEDVFKAIVEHFPPLENVRNLKLDLTCGSWDWDGTGSPQYGPSEQYRFPRISNHVQELDLIISDLLARQRKGPIELVNPKNLTKLKVEVNSCFAWVCIDFVRLFSDFTPTDFSSLTHLIIDDSIRDMRRWTVGGTMTQGDWQESGRTYVGLHKLIQSLPALRHLWVNERVLAIPSSDNADDTWETKAFDGDSQDVIMTRTAASPEWELLGCTFEKLESLRVGFGPLNASWVSRVLSLTNHSKLKAFGFDWEWQLGCNKPGVFSELIATLSKFESLTDLHILHPYAAIPTPIDYLRPLDVGLAVHRLHYNEETVDLAKGLLSELPGLCRVGVGRKSVYERQTRWKENGDNEFVVQRLHEGRVPSFYDAGSSLPYDMGSVEEKFDETPAIKDVLKLLVEL